MEDDKDEIAIKDLAKKLEKHFYFGTKNKGFLDGLQEKIVSRKLAVFVIATIFMITGSIDSDSWMIIATTYVGTQSMLDVVKIWKK